MNQAIAALIVVVLLGYMFGPETPQQPQYIQPQPDMADTMSDIFAYMMLYCLTPIGMAGIGYFLITIPQRRHAAVERVQEVDHAERRLQMDEFRHEVEMKLLMMRAQLVYPEQGQLPVSYSHVSNGHHDAPLLGLHSQYIEANKVHPNVPHTISYHHKPTVKPYERVEAEHAHSPSFTVPSFSELHRKGELPSNGFLLGYREDGMKVVKNWSDLYSCIVNGTSGGGKSTLVRLILAQAAMQGSRFVVADPHYGAGAESLGYSLRGLHSKMSVSVASNDAEISDLITYVSDIGNARLAGRDTSKDPLIFIIDEVTSLLQRSQLSGELEDALGLISTELRKVGVYAICMGQNFNSSIIKTNVRDCFASVLSTPAPRGTLGRMVSAESARTVETLKFTQALWSKFGAMDEVFTFPNTTEYDIELVSSSPVLNIESTCSDAWDVSTLEQAQNSQRTSPEQAQNKPIIEARVAQMYQNGESKNQIYQELFKGKMSKQRAWNLINGIVEEL